MRLALTPSAAAMSPASASDPAACFQPDTPKLVRVTGLPAIDQLTAGARPANFGALGERHHDARPGAGPGALTPISAGPP